MKRLILNFLKVNFYLCFVPFVVAVINLISSIVAAAAGPAEDAAAVIVGGVIGAIFTAASGVVALIFDRLAKKELAKVQEKSQVTKAAVFAIISGAFAWVGFGVAAGILMFILKPEGYPIVEEAQAAEAEESSEEVE